MLVYVLAFYVVSGLAGSEGQNGYDRLPDDTEPVSYSLTVVPNFDTVSASFTGDVEILITVKTTTAAITLNSKGLVLHDIRVTDWMTDKGVGIAGTEYDGPRQQVRIAVADSVLAGRRYTVYTRYRGILGDDAVGFFKRSYTTDTNETKWFAVTQFQTTHARSAFPCYDEPNYKTPFNISIKIKPNEIALSNTPVLNTVNEIVKIQDDPVEYRNRTWVHFKTTPLMTTSSVAYFVGEFEYLNQYKENSTNVYSHLGNLYQTEYVRKESPHMFEFLKSYTKIKYPLEKLDLIAVPEMYAGATASWGLIPYWEGSTFVDKNTDIKTKVSVKITTGCIIADQWFGNLVTPAWWDSAWLSKGFSVYFGYFGTATLEPEWRLDDFFIVEKQRTAMEYDQVLRHPLTGRAVSAKETDNFFDDITYNKGAAILKMLNSWVGEETFQNALNMYLSKNMYDVVKPEHLWNSFDNTILNKNSSFDGKIVRYVMDSWTEQIGYPVVNVVRKDKSLIFTQKRFLIEPTVDDIDTTKWYIRVTYTTNKNNVFDPKTAPVVLLVPTVNETSVEPTDIDAKDMEWYILNVQSTGFYRVNYTEDNWSSLIKQLNDEPLNVHVLNRVQLIDDSFNLARAGQLNYTVPLSLLKYLEKEDDVIPWFAAMNNLNYVLDRMRRDEQGYADFKDFVSKLADIIYNNVKKQIDEQYVPKYPISISWNAFSTWACKLDNEDCIRTALDNFRRWRNGEEILADNRDAALCIGLKNNTQQGDWAKVLNLYSSTKTYSVKKSALNALACTNSSSLLTKFLEQILENKFPIERQDHEDFFSALASTPNGINALMFFLQNHIEDIFTKVENGENMVTVIYSKLASKVSTKKETDLMTKIGELRTKTILNESKGNITSTEYQNEIDRNVKWFDSNSKTIREFIKPGSTTPPETTTPPIVSTQTPPSQTSNFSNNPYSISVILQILVMSISIKLCVNII